MKRLAAILLLLVGPALAQQSPPMPRLKASTETKGATLLTIQRAAVVVPVAPKEAVLRLPDNWTNFVWMIQVSNDLNVWRDYGWLGDTNTLYIRKGEFKRLKAYTFQEYLYGKS